MSDGPRIVDGQVRDSVQTKSGGPPRSAAQQATREAKASVNGQLPRGNG